RKFNGNRVEGIESYIFDTASSFSKGDISFDIEDISGFVKKYGPSIEKWPTAFLTVVWITLVLCIYLIDRLTFLIGYLVPPVLEFNLDEYRFLNKDSPRARHFRSLIGETIPFGMSYGAIRAYLGDKNTDKYRLEARAKLIRSLERAKTTFSYTK